MRIGIGVDAHRFGETRKLFLGGVEVPFEKGLSGHSDADVVLHAVMDALLGACGSGDIGQMFPDSDPAFLDASSAELMKEVVEVVREKGYAVVNVDTVVICEEPKIAPLRVDMQDRIANLCGVSKDAVSVKGTTTEGMGFTGRGEGVTCVAVVLIDKKEPPIG